MFEISELKKWYKQGNVFLELLEKNQGIEHALNLGLASIQKRNYEFIGRLDCGDLNLKNRFTKQLKYLDNNKDIYLLGSWVKYVNERGEKLFTLKHPVSYSAIKKKMFLNNMFVHPSVVFRSEILDTVGFYPTEFKAAEDYAFFFKIINKFKAENYPEVLLLYKIDSNSISSIKRKQQVKNRIRIIKKHFRVGFYPLYGIFRNTILFFLSRNSTNEIKKKINRKF